MSIAPGIYDGKLPKSKKPQVNPKARPGLPGKRFEIATKVIGIVKLNKNMPKIPKTGLFIPNINKGIDNKRVVTTVFCQPKRSAMIPPKALPQAIPTVNNRINNGEVFQGKTKKLPT